MTDPEYQDSDVYRERETKYEVEFKTAFEARKLIETELMHLGKNYCDKYPKDNLHTIDSPGFSRFLDMCSVASLKFLLTGVSINVVLEDYEDIHGILENRLGLNARFPSSETRPIIKYDFLRGICEFFEEPTDPYLLFVNSLRRGTLDTKHDRNFAYTILNHMKDNVMILGQTIVDPLDVKLFMDVIGEIYHLSQQA
jgi:hypothetical protein